MIWEGLINSIYFVILQLLLYLITFCLKIHLICTWQNEEDTVDDLMELLKQIVAFHMQVQLGTIYLLGDPIPVYSCTTVSYKLFSSFVWDSSVLLTAAVYIILRLHMC